MDVLINQLKMSGLGCHIANVYIGCIAYADDLILLSASLSHLQRMLNICIEIGTKLDIMFNANKSFLFKIGKVWNEKLVCLRLGGQTIQWTDNLKYLGIHFVSSKVLKFDVSDKIRKFYAAANAIHYHSKHVGEIVRLCLFESYTLPVLTYACEALQLSRVQMNDLNICWNNIYRKIFGLHRWESVKYIQLSCGRLDCIRLMHKRTLKFYCDVLASSNMVVYQCARLLTYNKYFLRLCKEYNVSISGGLGVTNVFLRFLRFKEMCNV